MSSTSEQGWRDWKNCEIGGPDNEAEDEDASSRSDDAADGDEDIVSKLTKSSMSSGGGIEDMMRFETVGEAEEINLSDAAAEIFVDDEDEVRSWLAQERDDEERGGESRSKIS